MTSFLAAYNADPHFYQPSNKVVQRLCRILYMRRLDRQTFTRVTPLRVYTHVAACEAAVLQELQSDSEADDQLYITGEHTEYDQNPLRQLTDSWGFRFFESVTCLVAQLADVHDALGAYNAIAQFLRAITGRSMTSMLGQLYRQFDGIIEFIINQVTLIYQRIRNRFAIQSEESDEDEIEELNEPFWKEIFSNFTSMEEFNPFSVFRTLIANCETHWQHPILQKIRTLFHYIMGFGLLDRFGITYNTFFFSKAEEEALKIQHRSTSGFAYALVDGVSYIMERMFDVYRTGTWNAILHNGKEYEAWVNNVYSIKEDSLKLHNPEANGFTYHDFVCRMEDCIEKGDAILRYKEDLPRPVRTAAKKLLSEIKLIKATECTKNAARQTRDAPFAILLAGGSSLGKSSLIDVIFSYFAKAFDLPEGDEYKYTRNAADQFWSGFTAAVWFIVLDDIAARNPNLNDDPSMNEVIQVNNSVPVSPPQADLADKGKVPLRPELVCATTNVKNLNAAAYYCNTLAILRRFPLTVEVYVKEEYAIRDGDNIPDRQYRMLDSSRVPPLVEGELPDLWDFKLQRIVAKPDGNSQTAKYVDLHEGYVGIYDFLSTMAKMAAQHRQNQANLRVERAAYKDITLCKNCFRLQAQCTCEVQSREWLAALSGAAIGVAALAGGYAVKKSLPSLREKVKHHLADLVVDTTREVVSRPMRQMKNVANNWLDVCRAKLASCDLSLGERLQAERQYVAEQFHRFGGEVQKFHFRNQKMLYGLLVAIPTIIGMYKMYSRVSTTVQGSKDTGSRLNVKDEKPNPWFRDDYVPSSFECGRLVSSWKNMSESDCLAKVSRNCIYATARYMREDGAKCRDFRAFCVGGHLYVTNAHNIPYDIATMQIDVIMGQATSGVNNNFSFRLNAQDVYRETENDLCFFRINCTPPKTDLCELLVEPTYKTQASGHLLSLGPNGVFTPIILKNIRRDLSYSPDGNEYNFWRAATTRETVKGECGSITLAFTPQGPAVLGLHHLGGGGLLEQKSVPLYRSSVDRAVGFFRQPIISGGPPNLTNVDGSKIVLQPIHHKSVLRYIDEGVGNNYGSFPGFRTKHTSKVTDTLIREAVEKRGYVVKTGPPVMRGWGPWRHAAKDIVQQKFDINQHILDECVDAFAKDIISGLSSDQLKEIIILDNVSTLNGQPGVKFIDKMNRRTSMGFPWKQKKLNFLSEPFQFEEWNDCVEFDEGFYKRVDSIIETYAHGQRHMPVFTAHLKDEATKFAKIEDEKTRVFAGAPADWCFVNRKYLLTFVRQVQLNKYLFESAPGTNATSAEWDEIYHYLTQFGVNRIVAGDYSKFDKRMSAQMILAAFRIIDMILEAAGWSDEDRLIVQCIGEDTCFPLTDFNGDAVEFWGSNPSGHPLTVIVNGLVNSLYVRYAWKMQGNDLSAFKANVSLLTYGDDNAMGVHERVNNFDHTIIQKRLEEIGVVYTMADKESESVPFISISDMTFLKRGWRYESEVGSHVAQIEHDSIAKMLTKCLPSASVNREAHAIQIMSTALMEYFFYGRQVFNEKRAMFLEIINELDLGAYYTTDFKTFDDLKAEYLNASMDFYPEGVCPKCVANH
jgi:hypothetical protein